MPNDTMPDSAKVVLVPVANPKTAPILLKLAIALADPEEGRVLALIVSLGEAEAEAKSIEAIEPIVTELQQQNHLVELVTEISTSVSRGILDTAREASADLLIIGLHQATRGQVTLGTVVESVIETAPCDVLVYRAGHTHEFKRVVVPVDGTMHARVAAHTALQLAQKYDAHIEAVHVQRIGDFQTHGLARIEWSLENMPGRDRVRRTVVTAQDTVKGILARVTEDDLLVVGFSERSNFERWLFGNVSKEILDRAPGPVILLARSAGKSTLARRMQRRLGWIRPTLTRVEQDEIARQSQEMAAPNLDYFVLILVSAVIASLGLLLNSAAVIIGAMLVAPLMQPLTAFATGLANGHVPLARRSSLTLLQGVLFALLVAVAIGSMIPSATPTPEMLARGNPSLLDAVVALASGFIAAYATARKDIPAALAGVAIAAALMPPLCTVGLGLAIQNLELGFGAGLLFLTNIICIIVAGWVVFVWLGMRPELAKERRQLYAYRNLVLAIVLSLLAIGILLNLTNRASEVRVIGEELKTLFPGSELIDLTVESGQPLRVIATIRSTRAILPSELQTAQDNLIDRLQQPVTLEVVFLRVLKPPS